MIHFICKKLQQNTRSIVSTTRQHVHFISTSTLKTILTNSSNSRDPKSLTLSYLINSCGLSLNSAIAASKKLHLYTTDNPDSVLNLLKAHGLNQTRIKKIITDRPHILLVDPHKTLQPNFELLKILGFSGTNLVKLLNKDPRMLESDALTVVKFFRDYGFGDKQISALIVKRPNLFMYNAQKNFAPKLEFFKSLGLSGEEIAQMLSSEPYILERSLENQIMPSVHAIKGIVGTDENVLKAITSCYRILEYNLEEVLKPNVEFLMSHGVPKLNVLKLVMIQSKALLVRTSRFNEVVGEVKKLGFDPMNLSFVLAIRSMAVMSKSLWERKLGVYGSFGLSKDEIIAAFKLQPMCMLTSEKKIQKMMDFFVNELKLKPSLISNNPNLMLLSLENRIIPRCSVLQLLMSKGLIKGDIKLVYAFRMTEKMFEERFVSNYQHLIPKIVDAYQGKIKFQGFPVALKF